MFPTLMTLLLLAIPAYSFVVYTPTVLPRHLTKSLYVINGGTEDFFTSTGWKPIQEDLNKVPVFTIATKEGNPLAYTIEMGEKQYNVPCFYCDVNAALEELKETKPNSGKDDGIDIIPFPLGKAFQLWAKDEAVIVPSKDSVLQAGAPPGTNPIGQQVPLFTCMHIAEEGEDGIPKLPVFFALEDANAAVKTAVEADGGNINDFEVVCLSLRGVIDQLATVPETSAFHFIPPSSSIKYIQEYLS